MEAREARQHTTTAEFMGDAPLAPATSYNSLEEIAAVAGLLVVRFDQPPGDGRYVRGDFHPIGRGAADTTWRMDVYAAIPAVRNGKRKIDLQYLGQAAGTLGNDPVSDTEIANAVWAKTSVFTSSGYAEALSGGALDPKGFPTGTGGPGNPAGLAVHDIGHAVALVFAPAKGAAGPVTAVSLMHQRWR